MADNPQENLKNNNTIINNNQAIIHQNINTYSRMILPPKSFEGLKFEFTNNPLSEIENCTGIIIKQELEFFEFVSGFERNISYNIFGQTPQGYKYLFKCIENTGCLMRWLCPTDIRSSEMNILHISSTNNDDSKLFANTLKPYKCPCFCLCRPEIFLTIKETNEKIGKIKEPFSCCDPIYEIYDNKDNIKYLVNAKCCQCGLLFANSICGRKGEAIFNIVNPETKEEIGTIAKKTPVISNGEIDNENYKITFPENASTHDKLLIIALGLKINYQYFEMDPLKII